MTHWRSIHAVLACKLWYNYRIPCYVKYCNVLVYIKVRVGVRVGDSWQGIL